MNPVLILPAAGEGSRFHAAGYTVPKPLIKVDGIALIDHAINPFLTGKVARIVVIAREKDRATFDEWASRFKSVKPLIEVVYLRASQEGAALSVLAALPHVADDDPVIIANSDQTFTNGFPGWLESLGTSAAWDGEILTFNRPKTLNDTKWSYVRTAPYDSNHVTEIAEKVVISDYATCGVYYFRSWQILRTAICKMVGEGVRHNGEFYFAPVYNYLIQAGMRVKRVDASKAGFVPLGTPEQVRDYIEATAPGRV